jgi:hypothetical protein
VADKRERVNGRFVKKSPFLGEKDTTLHGQNMDIFQMLRDYHSQHSDKGGLSDFMLE